MKYDSIIIGGGISGLISGIELTKAGQRVAIISSGQSALHFNSGSLGLLGRSAGKDVARPLEAIASLPDSHPYSRIGLDAIRELLPRVKPLFAEAGITLSGSEAQNHYRLTPIGRFKPTWLSMLDYATTPTPAQPDWGKVAVIAPEGYLDFYPDFISHGLEEAGLECVRRTLTLPELERLRRSSTEMRATNIARALTNEAVDNLARELNKIAAETGADTLLMPAIVGIFDEEPVRRLTSQVARRLRFVTSIPMSLGGMRAQILLRKHFQRLGGTCFIGDSVVSGKFDGDRLVSVRTVNHGQADLCADNFILATGSFFSHGLVSTPEAVSEPVFGLDVDTPAERSAWYEDDLFQSQRYMTFGVRTDKSLRASRSGRPVGNLRAIGSVLGGCDALKEESGGGIAILTAMKAAADIISDN